MYYYYYMYYNINIGVAPKERNNRNEMTENHMDDVILFRRFQGFVSRLIFSLMVKILHKNMLF